MSLFTRSFRRETKHLLQYRLSILRPSLETFQINFQPFLYSSHIPSISSLFYYEIASFRLPRLGQAGLEEDARDTGDGSLVQASSCCPQHRTPAWLLASAHAPDAVSLPAVWQTFPFVCAPCAALITLLKAKLDLYGRGSQLEASE